MTDTANGSSTFFEVGPTLVVCAGLVEINSFCVLVHFIEPELVVLTLVSQNIKSDATGFFTGALGIVFDHFHELFHSIRLDFSLDDD